MPWCCGGGSDEGPGPEGKEGEKGARKKLKKKNKDKPAGLGKLRKWK